MFRAPPLIYPLPMVRTLWILLLLAPLLAHAAEGYKRVLPDGTVEFSDQSDGGEAVDLPEAASFSSRRAYGRRGAPAPAESSEEKTTATPSPIAYRQLSITSPQADQTLIFTGGGVPVSVNVVPPLQAGHRLRILDGGKPVSEGTSGQVSLSDMFMGAHTLEAEVIDEVGKVLIHSAPLTFYIYLPRVKR